MSKVSDEMRKSCSLSDEKRDAGLTTPAYIRRFDDIPYGPDRDWNVLDVYRDRYRTGKLPVIMIVHGGGWVYGSKEVYQFYGMELAKRGFAVVNYSYRLAPENRFPASLQDTIAVGAWIMSHAEEYGFDTGNLFAVGDSAGAHLLGLFCAFLYNEDYRKRFRFPVPETLQGFTLRAVGMNCGAYCLFDKDGKGARAGDRELMKDLLTDISDPEIRKLVDVTAFVNADFPPAYIMTCEGDFLKTQAPLLQEAYEKAGAESELAIFGTKKKPLYHVFHVTVQEAEGQRCNDEECAFFMRHMR